MILHRRQGQKADRSRVCRYLKNVSAPLRRTGCITVRRCRCRPARARDTPSFHARPVPSAGLSAPPAPIPPCHCGRGDTSPARAPDGQVPAAVHVPEPAPYHPRACVCRTLFRRLRGCFPVRPHPLQRRPNARAPSIPVRPMFQVFSSVLPEQQQYGKTLRLPCRPTPCPSQNGKSTDLQRTLVHLQGYSVPAVPTQCCSSPTPLRSNAVQTPAPLFPLQRRARFCFLLSCLHPPPRCRRKPMPTPSIYLISGAVPPAPAARTRAVCRAGYAAYFPLCL